jgi:hypothetical protein
MDCSLCSQEIKDFFINHPQGREVCYNNVTTLIDYILSDGGDGVNLDAADVDQDGTVTINDVTTLIDYIFKGTW